MEPTRLRENLIKVENIIVKKTKPTPLPSSYSSHQYMTPIESSKDPYTYITPFIKYCSEDKNGEIFIYLLTKSQKHVINNLYGNLVKVMVFNQRKDTLEENIKGCLLVATTCQIKLFGIKVESDEITLCNTGVEISLDEDITRVSVSEEGSIVFSSKYNFYEICYFYGFFGMSFVHKLKSFKKFMSEFIWKETNEIRDIAVSNKYAIAMRDGTLEIYKVKSKSSFLKSMKIKVSCAVEFYSDDIFYTVDDCGNRTFYNIDGEISNIEIPQEMTYYDGDAVVIANPDVFCYLKKRKSDSNCILMVITQNAYFRGRETPRENYQCFYFNDVITRLEICNRSIIMASRCNTYKTRIMPMHEYLLNCKQEEIKKMYTLLGNSDFMMNYLFMIENNLDTSKIEFLFLKNEDYGFVYRYIYHVLSKNGLYGKDTECNFNFKENHLHLEGFLFNLRHRTLVELATVYSSFRDIYEKLWKYRKSGLREAIEDLKIVMNSVLFVKIVKERTLEVDFSFKSLMFDQKHREKVFSKISNEIGFERANEIFAKKLRDFFPIEQIHFQRGLQNVKRKRKDALYESLNDFKECSNYKETLNVYMESKFYTGCITLIRDCIYGSLEPLGIKKKKFSLDSEMMDNDSYGFAYYLGLMMKHLLCKGSLLKALEDFREEFIYLVLEAYMRNLINGVFFVQDCTCCDRNDETFYYNNSVDLIFLKTPFLLPFLEEKAMLSNNEHQYVLLWKYHMLNKDRVLAQKHLLEVIRTKPMTFKRRLELLRLSVNIDSTPYMKSIYEAALIQNELIQADKENAFIRSRLLDPNELFNDYLYPDYEYLSLKMMKITKYDDINIKRLLFDKLLGNDYTRNVEHLGFISDLNKNDWVEIEIVGDVLIRCLERTNTVSMVSVLMNFGYSEPDIKSYLENRIRGTVFMNTEVKRRILNEFIGYFGVGDVKSKEVKQYCMDNFGIKN